MYVCVQTFSLMVIAIVIAIAICELFVVIQTKGAPNTNTNCQKCVVDVELFFFWGFSLL